MSHGPLESSVTCWRVYFRATTEMKVSFDALMENLSRQKRARISESQVVSDDPNTGCFQVSVAPASGWMGSSNLIVACGTDGSDLMQANLDPLGVSAGSANVTFALEAEGRYPLRLKALKGRPPISGVQSSFTDE